MRRKVIWVLEAALAIILAVSLVMVIRTRIEHKKTLADASEAAEIAGLHTGPASRQPGTTPPASGTPQETASPAQEALPEATAPPAEPLPEEAAGLIGLDLEALRAYNEDVVGWITIPGTAVSYPLVQRTDNQYYLNHNWKKEYSGSGSIFLSSDASRDLTDFNTIVYGHHMLDETMFGTFKYYFRGPDYWRQHPSVYIVLDDAVYRYDIFAVEEAGIKGIVYRLDIEEKHLEEEFLQYCKNRSVYDTGLTPGADDRVLSLSTCTGTLSQTSRWVLHGVLAQEYRRTNF